MSVCLYGFECVCLHVCVCVCVCVCFFLCVCVCEDEWAGSQPRTWLVLRTCDVSDRGREREV